MVAEQTFQTHGTQGTPGDDRQHRARVAWFCRSDRLVQAEKVLQRAE